MVDFRYLQNEVKFLDFAYSVLDKYFDNRESYISYYNTIASEEKKNKFLKIASSYKFLVAHGNYHNEDESYDRYIYYLDHSYKYVAIFAMIEDLYSVEEYKDFYAWLRSSNTKIKYPIDDSIKLEELHKQYLLTHGSTSKVVKFFESLTPATKEYIAKKISRLTGNRTQKEDFISLAKKFYEIRSNFVHKAEMVTQFSESTTIHSLKKKRFINNLDLEDLKMIFEEGLIIFFKHKEV